MLENDTIAAISTGMTSSGIGIIRISGSEALNIIGKIFVSEKGIDITKVASHTVHYGNIFDNLSYLSNNLFIDQQSDRVIHHRNIEDTEHEKYHGEREYLIDEVLVLVMKAPHTYTKEDIVEIQCHGGIYVVKKILEIVLKNGARCAQPGEFTKRAFLNGRIDLSQAEAVADLINAKSSIALKQSVSQLKGSIKELIKKLREKIIFHIAYIEAALDDPEHISLDSYGEILITDVDSLLKEMEKLLNTSENGKLIKEGIKTVILGKPNAGKSSLLNTLLGEERAIVTDVAGTTRDTLEESLKISDLLLNIVDTAGIRETDDIVEKMGVMRSVESAGEADLVIYVVDASVPIDENDREIMRIISDKKCIVLLNKTDLECIVNKEDMMKIMNVEPIEISVKNNIGIDLFEKKVREMFYEGKISFDEEIYITNLRHKEALSQAYDSLLLVKESILSGMPEDFYSIDLMNAYEQLGKIIGEAVEDDLVNEIFAKFCMGK